MTIIEYINARKMTVLIESTLITGDKAYYIKENVQYDRFLKGMVKSPFDPSVYGVGYLGVGPYSIDVSEGLALKPSNVYPERVNPLPSKGRFTSVVFFALPVNVIVVDPLDNLPPLPSKISFR